MTPLLLLTLPIDYAFHRLFEWFVKMKNRAVAYIKKESTWQK